MDEVAGKTAFVTGGASGIGLGMAEAFVAEGMNVVIADLRPDHVETALQRFDRSGARKHVHAIELDVTDREAFARAADEAETVFGNVHVLCNNAGMGILGPVTARALRRLGLGPRCIARRCRQRDPDVPAAADRARRRRAHRQHVVDGRRRPDPRCRDLHHGQGRGDRALGGAPERARREGIGVSAFCPGPVQTNIREGGRTRPERYADSGYAELEQELEERTNSPLWMDPRECGERVLAGIRRNDLYIFTHREFREGADERFRAMLASFPDEPLDDERADDIRFLLSNPIFRTVFEQRSV